MSNRYKRRKTHNTPIMRVYWTDAAGGGDPADVGEYHRETVGFAVEDNKRRIVLFATGDRGGWEDYTTIPRKMIDQVTILWTPPKKIKECGG